MESQPRQIEMYATAEGRVPFVEWYLSLANLKAKVAVEKRIDRIALGNFGDCKSLGEHLYELKIPLGPGYRLYFTHIENQIVLLLTAGDKSSHPKDIETARRYAHDYRTKTRNRLL